MFNRIIIPRNRAISIPIDKSNNKLILRSHIHTLNSLAVCIKMNWMPILVIILYKILIYTCRIELSLKLNYLLNK